MRHIVKFFTLVITLGVMACAPDIHAVPEQLAQVAPPPPRELQPQTVNIEVVTRENIATIQKQVSGNQDSVYLFLTPRDYENLIANLADIQRYIQQQKAVLGYYVTIVHGADAAPQEEPSVHTTEAPKPEVPSDKPKPRSRK